MDRQHIFILLYLVLEPPQAQVDTAPHALTLLYRLLDIHEASTLTPLIPSRSSSWATWWANWQPEGKLERRVRRRVEECKHDGIWPLIWAREPRESKPSTRGTSRDKSRANSKANSSEEDEDEEMEEEEEEEEVVAEKVVSDRGWEVLEWLVALWEKDAVTSASGRSEAMVAQLGGPPKHDIPRDNADVPLAIIRQAFDDSGPSSFADTLRHRSSATSLLALLIGVATPPLAPFHQASLVFSLVQLLRTATTPLVAAFKTLPWQAHAHVFAHALEDAAGVRAKNEKARNTSRARRGGQVEQKGWEKGPWSPPTPEYALDLVALPPADRSDETAERMGLLGASLVMRLVANVSDGSGWERAGEDEYLDGVSESKVLRATLKVAARAAWATPAASPPPLVPSSQSP